MQQSLAIWLVVSKMALFKYFSRETSTTKHSSSLTIKEKEVVRDFVRKAEENQGRRKYNEYTAEERAAIGNYTAEKGPAKACKHFSRALGRSIPESSPSQGFQLAL